MELQVIKTDGALVPYMEQDREKLAAVKQGQPFRITATRQSRRSVQHNRLYWGGLIRLLEDYWHPAAGCISPNEEAILASFCRFVAKQVPVGEAMETVRQAFTERLRASRAERLGTPAVDRQAIHDWIKEELGMFDLYLTPSGWKKKLRSTNFNSMDQWTFTLFYAAAFNVAWKFILSRQFTDPQEAQVAIHRLMDME